MEKMLNGHGDDILNFKDIRVNLSSNVYPQPWNAYLFDFLAKELPSIENYPEATPSRLEKEIAEQHGIPHDDVIVTSGATEAIYIIAHAFQDCQSSILQPTFAEYHDACNMFGHQIKNIFDISDIDDSTQVAWICNPNNPTGETIRKDRLTDCITQHPNTYFVIDASYAPFTDKPTITAKDVIGMENIILLHSMTKEYSIPGLRLGYAVTNKTFSKRLQTFRIPWSVNVLAIKAGHYLLAHKEHYLIDHEAIRNGRENLTVAIKSLNIKIYPSDTHILLCKLPGDISANELKQIMAEDHGILIRDASNFPGLTPQHFRIAVHSHTENEAFIKALKVLLETRDVTGS